MAKLTMTKLTPTLAWQHVAQRFYPLVLLLALGLLAWLVASSIWLAIAPPTAPMLQPVALTPPAPKANNTNQFELFAKPAATPTNQPTPDIKIVGVTVASPAIASYAILNSGGKTLSYRIGDMIGTSQYKLSKVMPDFIVVTAPDGTTQKVDFGQKFSLDQSEAIRAKAQNSINPQGAMANNTPNTTSNNPMNTGMANNGLNSPIRHNGDNQPSAVSANANNPNTSQSALSTAAAALQQNPAGYLSSMGVAATGQGYQVTDAMPANIKNRIGLQTGDKVLSVNGQSVGQNPAQDAQVLQQVQQSGQAQIQVQRGEQVITIRQSL